MNMLVGYTGFVGSNLYRTGTFDEVYNSKNIETAYGLRPDLLVYAGVRAEKYLANNFPEKDREAIIQAKKNIDAIRPQKLVLISTIDVLDTPNNADEDVKINSERLQPYGRNRYELEEWVRAKYPDSLIIRLPALFGKNIKKNFIYDYINVIPFMLKAEKYAELVKNNSDLEEYYQHLDNGFYQCKDLSQSEKVNLRQIFMNLKFTALNFTDSRSVFQFYPLERLWDDINTALDNDLHIWHAATEPVSAAEVYQYMEGTEFINELGATSPYYDYRTKHFSIWGGHQGYICSKNAMLEKIAQFICDEKEHNC